MRNRNIWSWIFLLIGITLIYCSSAISEFLFPNNSNHNLNQIVSVLVVFIGIFFSGLSLKQTKFFDNKDNLKTINIIILLIGIGLGVVASIIFIIYIFLKLN